VAAWIAAPAFFVVAAWIAFGAIFLLRKKTGASATPAKRDPMARWGIILQAVSYSMVWWSRFWRGGLKPIVPMPLPAQVAVACITIAIAGLSVWLTFVSVRTLGRQWALQAQVVEGHKLIVEGPYRWMRNPIYTAMLGMMIATGLAFATSYMLLGAIVVHLAGIATRVRTEEKLLAERFGEEFQAYKRRVPALLPHL
jgi:protein-S-isoprenylcysteine O-methyltransferase Ste14